MVDLPPMPDRIARLPRDARGYPVPWFASWFDGVPNFQVVQRGKAMHAYSAGTCWVCGGPLGQHLAVVIGPMCAVNRTTAEPASHRDCAIWSARACPFLTRPKMHRVEANLPADKIAPPGIMLDRNPGVVLVWMTRKITPFQIDTGVLFQIGDPTATLWFAEGREATRAEIMASLDSGLPALMQLADGPADVATIEAAYQRVVAMLPA